MNLNHITFFPTGACNLRCQYCFTTRHDWPKDAATPEVARAAVDMLFMASRSDRVNIGFFGGEPLLRWDICSYMCNYALERARIARKEVAFSITTNGTLLTEKIADEMKQLRMGVLLSMDGLPHEENQRLDHKGQHTAQVVLEKARMLRDKGLQLTIRWTVPPELVKHIYSDAVELANMGFRLLAIEPVYEVEWSSEARHEWITQMEKVAWFYKSELRAGRNLVVKPIDDAIGLFAAEERLRSRCGTATGGVGVAANGDIYPCHRFVTMNGPKLGNVLTGWDLEALRKAQEWDISKVHPVRGTCRDCPVQLRCPGGCICVNLDTTGDKYVPPELYCWMMRTNQRIVNDLVQVLYAEKNPILMRKLERPDLRT